MVVCVRNCNFVVYPQANSLRCVESVLHITLISIEVLVKRHLKKCEKYFKK